MSNAPAYKRILLKLSGEALMGDDSYGINRTVIEQIVAEIAEVVGLGVQVAIVIGGGNIFRGVAPAAPALTFLQARGAQISFGAKLRAFEFDGERVQKLDFGEHTLALGADDKVILAVTAPVAAELLPNLSAPNEFRSIVNAHFACPPPRDMPLLTGVVGGWTEWLFAFADRLSVTISAAERFLATSREELAEKIWAEVQQVAGISAPLPPWQIIKEKRATFAATPAQDALRRARGRNGATSPSPATGRRTGLPSTIEGAIRSGLAAAREVSVS